MVEMVMASLLYIHRFSQKSDTGLSIELLHNYIFIPLDIFRNKYQNKNISTELDAWLRFLSTDNPDEIMRLCDAFPSFRDLYKHIYEICRNTEDVMGIFSEALAELDRNTVDYMIDNLKKENVKLLGEYEQSLDERKQLLVKYEQLLVEIKQSLDEKKQLLVEYEQSLDEREQLLVQYRQLLVEYKQIMDTREQQLQNKNQQHPAE